MSEFEDPDQDQRTWHGVDDQEVSIEAILVELLSVVENAKSMPLSSSAIVSREELIELIEAARRALPDELARARRMLQDHEELLQRADYEAAQLLDAARAQAAHLVSRTEVARQARSEAERMLLDADAESRRIRHEAEDYVDRKLASFEIVLDRTVRTVRAGRERLAGVPAMVKEESPPGDPQPGDADFTPFDQDL